MKGDIFKKNNNLFIYWKANGTEIITSPIFDQNAQRVNPIQITDKDIQLIQKNENWAIKLTIPTLNLENNLLTKVGKLKKPKIDEIKQKIALYLNEEFDGNGSRMRKGGVYFLKVTMPDQTQWDKYFLQISNPVDGKALFLRIDSQSSPPGPHIKIPQLNSEQRNQVFSWEPKGCPPQYRVIGSVRYHNIYTLDIFNINFDDLDSNSPGPWAIATDGFVAFCVENTLKYLQF